MKKALMMPLLLGMVWLCNASPMTTVFSPSLTAQQQMIEESLLEDIFEVAAPQFASEHGVEISPSALMNGYYDGSVTVEDLGNDSYKVVTGGNVVISTLEDFL